jgi:cytoskeletal protein CcmA (bactofilin family)
MTTIGPSLIIKGDVTSDEDITIHGKVVGTLSMQGGTLLIAPHATVEAEAEGAKLIIHGKFSGQIGATERVELTNTANVQGKIVAPAVILQDGAVFNGTIHVERRANTGLRETIAGTAQVYVGEVAGNAAGAKEPVLAKTQ